MPDLILSRGEVRSLRNTGYEVSSDHKPNKKSILEALETEKINNDVSGSYSVLPGQAKTRATKPLTREEIIDALFRSNANETNEVQNLRNQALERIQILQAQLSQTNEEEKFPLLLELRLLEEASKLNNDRVYRLRYDAIQRRLYDINSSAEYCTETENLVEALLKSNELNQESPQDSKLKIFEHHLNTGVLEEDAKVFKQLRIIFQLIEDTTLKEKVQDAEALMSNLGNEVKVAEKKWGVYIKFNNLGERFCSLYNNVVVTRDIISDFLMHKDVILFGRCDRDELPITPEDLINQLKILLSSYTSITDKQRVRLEELLSTTAEVARKNQALAKSRPCSNFQLLMNLYNSVELRMKDESLPEECLSRLEILKEFTANRFKELKTSDLADKI